MLRTLWNGVSALNSQQTLLDTTANNIANANTPAYKKEQTSFADLLYGTMSKEGNPVIDSKAQNGTGTRVSTVIRDFRPGVIVKTQRPLDVAIEGEGFFQVKLPNGSYAYTRSGSFQVDAGGVLVNEQGQAIQPHTILPPDFKNITIASDGAVSVETDDGQNTSLGRFKLFKFQNPAGLQSMGNNLYKATDSSGEAVEGIPGKAGNGTIQSGALEMSNVNLVEEMSQIIESQRAYQINARSIQAVDEMWNIANNIRK